MIDDDTGTEVGQVAGVNVARPDDPDDDLDPTAAFAKAMQGGTEAVDLDTLFDVLERQNAIETEQEDVSAAIESALDTADAIDDATTANAPDTQDFAIFAGQIDLVKAGFTPTVDVDDSGTV